MRPRDRYQDLLLETNLIGIRSLTTLSWITRLVLFNLEAQEFVDCRYGLLISRNDDDTTSRSGLLERVLNLVAETLHLFHSWGDSIVHKHRNVEVPVPKSMRDMRKMPADVVAIGCVCGVVDFHLDYTTIGLYKKMMCGGGLRKAHSLFAPLVESCGRFRTV